MSQGPASASVEVKVRFLQMTTVKDWQEGLTREVNMSLSAFSSPVRQTFSFNASETVEGELELRTVRLDEGLFRMTLIVRNLAGMESASRGQVLLRSMVSVHSILHCEGGEFVSLLDPPERFKKAAAECQNVGAWPVLAGDEEQRDMMLSSPIILYDYPQIAPESPGDLCDGLEIDEILALRILTMTDAEKEEVRNGDDRARKILERTEMLPPEHFQKLHGAVCEDSRMNEWEWQLLEDKAPVEFVLVNGVEYRVGDRVRLQPHKGGDIMDVALSGKDRDYRESSSRITRARFRSRSVLEDDPGRDLGMLRQPGHRFFFSAEEIEAV